MKNRKTKTGRWIDSRRLDVSCFFGMAGMAAILLFYMVFRPKALKEYLDNLP